MRKKNTLDILWFLSKSWQYLVNGKTQYIAIIVETHFTKCFWTYKQKTYENIVCFNFNLSNANTWQMSVWWDVVTCVQSVCWFTSLPNGYLKGTHVYDEDPVQQTAKSISVKLYIDIYVGPTYSPLLLYNQFAGSDGNHLDWPELFNYVFTGFMLRVTCICGTTQE